MKLGTFVVAASLTLAGCQKSSGNHATEISRAVCDKLASCGQLGTEGEFASLTECKASLGKRYRSMWPNRTCEQNMNEQRFEACKSRALAIACESKLLDVASSTQGCEVQDVCVGDAP